MKVTDAYLQNILDKSEIAFTDIYGRCLIAVCKLPNQYIIVESSTVKDEKDFDIQIATNNCIEKLKRKISELENYLQIDRETYGYDLENEFIDVKKD